MEEEEAQPYSASGSGRSEQQGQEEDRKLYFYHVKKIPY